MIDKDAVLYYNGHMHRFSAVINSAKATNYKVKVDIAKIHNAFEQHRAMVSNYPVGLQLPDGTPTILYKFEDKYIMLTNSDKIMIGQSGEVEGYVLSSVGLKKCRIPDDQIPRTVPQASLDACNNHRSRAGLTQIHYAGSSTANPAKAPEPSVRPYTVQDRVANERNPDSTYSRYGYARGRRY